MSSTFNDVQPQTTKGYHVITEGQVYSQLKRACDNGNRADFAMLLAMLSDDAAQFDQFHLAKTKEQSTPSDLYQQFHVRKHPITGDFNQNREQYRAQCVKQGFVSSVHLMNALNPEPLLKVATSPFPQEVLDNLNVNQLSRLNLTNRQGVVDAKPQEDSDKFDIDGWFNVLDQVNLIPQVA